MPFPPLVRNEALVKSHRRCCVCHEFGGRSVNVHHIIQEADGGPNTIENAICLCLRCHAEAGHFNSRHPMGTKYSPTELRAHRDQWWQHCLDHPDEPFQPSLDVHYEKPIMLRSATLHKYRLIATYTNQFKEAQTSWKIQMFIPIFVPANSMGFERNEKIIDGIVYNTFEYESNRKIYPGDSVDIIPSLDTLFIEYQFNTEVFWSLHEKPHVVFWHFFTSDAKPIDGEKPLAELNDF